VIGAAIGVFGHAPAEFAEGHHQHALQIALRLQITHKGVHGVAQFLEQPLLRAGLIDMRVVTALET
jgi:hypothetical protein